MQVQSLGQEDALAEGLAIHPSIFAWRIPWQATVHGVPQSRTRLKQLSMHESKMRFYI